MGKQRAQASRKKSTQKQNEHKSEKKTPESLMAQGDFQEAIRLLRGHIRSTPSDEKKRLLGECLFKFGQYQEAAAIWLTIQEKTADDFQMLGITSLNTKDWDQAVQFLNESAQQKENGYIYYLLSIAHLRGYSEYNSNLETKRIALNLLQRARASCKCPAHGYLLLERIRRSIFYEDSKKDDEAQGQIRDQARLQSCELLEEAFLLYPDDDEVRLEYAKSVIYRKEHEKALAVLAPLVNRDERSEETIAWAINASIEARLFEKAHQYLDILLSSSEANKHSYETNLAQLRGDIFRYQTEFERALVCYEQQRQSEAFANRFLGAFNCAWVWLLQEQKEKAITLAREGATLWFKHDDLTERCSVLDTLPFEIGWVFIGDESYTLCVKRVCEHLLADDVLPDTELKGQLSYLVYQYYAQYDERFSEDSCSWSQKAEAQQLLLQAAQLYSHPLMSSDLSSLFLGMGDVQQSIMHHLTSRKFSFTHEPEIFDEEYAEFAYSRVSVTTEEERRKIHEAALSMLGGCDDAEVIEAVFTPFFISFWRPLLQDGKMIQELVTVTKTLMDATSEINDVWFYHAWGLSVLGHDNDAELIYMQLLEHIPDDACALHNLAQLLRKKNSWQEALALSSKAASLAPHDEIIVNGYNRLKGQYEEQAQTRAVFLEQVQLWSSLSDSQKRLLCLMELCPATSWEKLLPHLRKKANYALQLQEDWDWLLEHGMCTQSGTELPMQVIPQIQPLVWNEGFYHWLVAEIVRVQPYNKRNPWVPDVADLRDEHLAALTKSQRDILQQALTKHIGQFSRSGLEHCHLPFYRRIWKKLLIEWEMYAELVGLCEHFLTYLPVMHRQELWECAYYATNLSSFHYRRIAEERYKAYLAQGETNAAYHNLALLYFRDNKNQDALSMIEQALKLDPSDDMSVNLKAKIERGIAQEAEKKRQEELQQQQKKEQQAQRIKDLEQTIQAHLSEADYYKRNILQTLNNMSSFRGKRSFARYVAMEEWALEGHWKKLVSWGMIVEIETGPIVHPLVCTYLEQGWPIAFKPRDKTPELAVANQLNQTMSDSANGIGALVEALKGIVVTSPPKGNKEMTMVKALFLAANPITTNPLAIDEEMRAIEQKLRAAEHRDVLIFQSAWAVRPDDLLQRLNESRPHIVHFSGHGNQHGLCLAGDDGKERLVTTRALTHLFAAIKDNIQLVFLNACYSREQAQALITNIDCVIGMKKSIHDNAAKIFASSFYRAIGFGRSVQEAFDQGIAALLLEDISDEDVPELLTRDGVDPRQIVLIRPVT